MRPSRPGVDSLETIERAQELHRATRHKGPYRECSEPYPHQFRTWPRSARRSAARLAWLRNHGCVGLRFAAALLMRTVPTQKR